MIQRKIYIWKMGVFLILIASVLFSFVLFQRQSNHQERHLFIVNEPPLISLDHDTFHNESLFQRAAMLTASSFNLESIIRRFSSPVTSLTSFSIETSEEQQKIYATQGFNLIQISPEKGTDKIFSFKGKITSPIIALSFHPVQKQKILALCENREFLSINLEHDKPTLSSLGIAKIIPNYMNIEEMWPNPFKKTITISLSSSQGTLLIEVSPQNLNLSLNEMILPQTILRGGFSISRQIELAVDTLYRLHVIDTEKRLLIGNFIPNPNFKYADLYKTEPAGFISIGEKIYLSDSYNNIMKLSWMPNPYGIIINRDVEIKNGKIVLKWRMPKESKKTLFFAELSLISQSPTLIKKKNLAVPADQIQIPFGPSQHSFMELPYFETATRSFDINLFAIHSRNGKMISPATTFTIDTERAGSYERK